MLFLLAACATDCESWMVTDPEECHYQVIKTAFEESLTSKDQAALEQALTHISDPTSRDLTLVRLAVAYPAQASTLCGKVKADIAKEKCQQILGRPHLQDIKTGQ